MRLAGVVSFRELPATVRDATVRVRLLDTSRADAASQTVADQTIQGVSLDGAEVAEGVSFAFDAPDPAPGRTYVLAAHVDVSGNGKVEPGDYITMESLPVEPRSAGAHFEVPVRLVRS
jgi:uncharacterized lipoprotein YbaY